MNTKEIISSFFTRKRNNTDNINELISPSTVVINYNLPIGDYLSLSPIIDAIEHKWNTVSIYIICSQATFELVSCDPRVRPLCFPDKKNTWKYPNQCKKVLSDIGPIDLLIEPCKLNRSFRSLIGYCLKPRLTIGLYWDRYHSIANPIKLNPKLRLTQMPKPHMYREMMQDYGFKIIDDNYRVYEKEESKQKIKSYLRQHNVQSYLIINPFASTTKRTLPLIQVQKIVKSAHQLYAHIILLIPPYVDNIQEWKNIDNTILCPPINSIMDSVSYIKNSSMVLSVDTSIVHIASAFNKPIVALYREQDLATSCWLPTSKQQVVLSLHSSPEQISNQIKMLRDHNKINISP